MSTSMCIYNDCLYISSGERNSYITEVKFPGQL